jgi:UDP-N-acetylglucosamine 2-epimerase (non-hydrolysing)
MRVAAVLGTRPEIIRLSRVIELLDRHCELVLIHTGQNYDPALSDVFFEELGVRAPDHHLGIIGEGFAERVGGILAAAGPLLAEIRADKLLVLGDTDSALSAYIAKRMGIPVFHMEAGNRCFDDRVPEEVNRRLIDHASDVLMPYTERSRDNLMREGIHPSRIVVTGNPIKEVMNHHASEIAASNALSELGVTDAGYLLMTVHRQETVDFEERFRPLLQGATASAEELGVPLVFSVHPRTRSRLEQFGIALDDEHLRPFEPFGFVDFVALERHARCVLTDSGTVQEECCIMGVPAVTVRDTTERPETVECGSNILSGTDPDAIRRCVEVMLDGERSWTPPPEYLVDDVSGTVADVLL